jgi:hypothetical protein
MTNLSSSDVQLRQWVTKRKTPQRGVLVGEPDGQKTHNGKQAQRQRHIFAGGTDKHRFHKNILVVMRLFSRTKINSTLGLMRFG